MRPTKSHLRMSSARTDALFMSAAQCSELPSARQVQEAIAGAVRQFGRLGCAERVAQEFGDHPEMAVTRMRWACRIVDEAFGGPQTHAAARIAFPG